MTYSIIERLSWYVITSARWMAAHGWKCSCASAAVSPEGRASRASRIFGRAERAPGGSSQQLLQSITTLRFSLLVKRLFDFANHRLQITLGHSPICGQRPPNLLALAANCNWPCRLREGALLRVHRFSHGGTRPCTSAAFRSRWSAPSVCSPFSRVSSPLTACDVPWNLA